MAQPLGRDGVRSVGRVQEAQAGVQVGELVHAVGDAPLEGLNLTGHCGTAILEGGDGVLVAFGRHAP